MNALLQASWLGSWRPRSASRGRLHPFLRARSHSSQSRFPGPGRRRRRRKSRLDVPTKRKPTVSAWRLILALGFLAIVGTGAYLVYWLLQSHEIAALSVQSEPPGAAILLDGKPPQAPPNTFTHVPLGTHQLTATLDEYEPIKLDVEVRSGMTSPTFTCS